MNHDFSMQEKAVIRAYALSKQNGQYRTTCPACSLNRRNASAQCLSVTVFSERVVYNCHHCECMGATYLMERNEDLKRPFVPPVMEAKPKKTAVKRLDLGLTQDGIDYLSSRLITLPTAQLFGLTSARAWFRDLDSGREAEAIAFPYFVSGSARGHKFRCIEQKEHCCDVPLSSLFGVQNVDLKESGDLLICEGEFDPLAFYEAGVCNGTSVPNGSSSFARSNDDGTMKAQLGFLWEARDVIDKAKRVLIAVDNDEPGEKLAEELARRIGKHRCWRVFYPDGCKDANDVLKAHGKASLADCAASAKPWPVEGLYEAEKYYPEVYELFENGFGEKIRTGMSAVDELFSVGRGLLTVVTGIPGNGKSTFVDQLLVNLARSRGYVSAICSFENPPQVHIGKIAQCLYQKHFFKTPLPGEMITRKELDEVLPFIHRHFKFIQQEDGRKATIESIVERIKTAVFRWGCQLVVVDPYNYIARGKTAESETQWIDDMLTELRLLAGLYDLHIFFVAHPTKMQMNGDGSYMIPKGYSISGSAAWFSKPDFGITVHRVPDTSDVKIVNWKTRYDWLGKVGETTVFYDNVRHTYISDDWSDNEPFEGKAA